MNYFYKSFCLCFDCIECGLLGEKTMVFDVYTMVAKLDILTNKIFRDLFDYVIVPSFHLNCSFGRDEKEKDSEITLFFSYCGNIIVILYSLL